MRLIDADALHHELIVEMVKCIRANDESKGTTAERVLNRLNEAPTIDAVPVVHGRWLKTEEPSEWREVDCAECSVCHDSWIVDEDYGYDFLEFWRYCPSCGAKMDLEVEA